MATAYHCCARILGLRSVCPRCARLRARTVCTVYSCSLSSTCACSSPCLLRVPMRCVLGLCALVPFPFVYSTAYFVLFPAFGCASERCHRSRCPQLNTPATLFITHFLRSLLPLCLLCFPAALLSFLPKKKTRRPCDCELTKRNQIIIAANNLPLLIAHLLL